MTLEHRFEDGWFFRRRSAARPRGTLVWIHGLGESGLCFERIAAHPEFRRFDQLIPDLPGYGRSPWPTRPERLERLALAAALWVEARAATPPVIWLGHSMGGVLATLAAERRPRAVQAVVDIDGNITSGDCTFSGRAASRSRAAFLRGGLEELRRAVHRKGVRDEALRGYAASLAFADPASFYRHSVDLVRLSRDGSLARRLAALGIPVLYVAGSPGGACPRSLAALRREGVPVAVVAPAGHWPFVDAPDEFAAAVAAFLRDAASG